MITEVNKLPSAPTLPLIQTFQQSELTPKSTLEAVDIECVRGNRVLFSNVDFCLRSGEIQQVEGVNGVGKTSLLRIVCGLSPPESGEIRWNGVPIHRQRPDYYQELSYIGHTNGVKLELTPLENLQMSRALSSNSEEIDLEEILEQVGLLASRNLQCRYLSAGQRRRVAITRLFLTRAHLWVLDEPITGIDREGISEIESLLASHVDRGGMLLLTSHQPLRVGSQTIHKIQISP